MDEIFIDKTELSNIIKKLPEIASCYFIHAKTTKILYDAYVQVGFTDEQALEIIKARGLVI